MLNFKPHYIIMLSEFFSIKIEREADMSKKILVVDDMMFARKSIEGILRACGCDDICEAASATEALKIVVEQRPDLVMLDLNLPDCSDLSALKLILEAVPEQKIVICSAINEFVVIDEAKRMGAKAFIAKPFTAEQYIQVIEPILNE